MQVSTDQIDPCTLVLDISIDQNQVVRTFDSVYREFSRHTNVPGFRPGKAPRAIVERYVNTERVRDRALQRLIDETCGQAIRDQGVVPYRQPEVSPPDLEDGKEFSYKAIVPLEPQVKLGPYTGLTIEKPRFTVTDEMVDRRIEEIREQRTRLERVTDRGVAADDVLVAENQVRLEGETEPAPARRQLIYLGRNIPGFDEALLGMMPGEERTFELAYPDDFDEAEKRGKKATFTVALTSISARRAPEIDDDFAMAASGVASVDLMRGALRDQLAADLVRFSDQVAEQRIIEQILAGSEIFFPQVLIGEEADGEFRNLAGQLREANMTYEAWLAQSGLTAEQHRDRVIGGVTERIRALLALRQIAEEQNLTATPEEVSAEFERLLNEGKLTAEQHAEYIHDSRRQVQLANALVQQKLHAYLFANNTLNEVDQTETPDAEDMAAGDSQE